MHTPRSGAALGAVAMPVVVWRWTGREERGWRHAESSAFRPGVGAHHTGNEPM